MENTKPTSDEAVIQHLAVEKVNLEIQNVRLQHALAEARAELDALKSDM